MTSEEFVALHKNKIVKVTKTYIDSYIAEYNPSATRIFELNNDRWIVECAALSPENIRAFRIIEDGKISRYITILKIEWLEVVEINIPSIDHSKYPHKCPTCKGPAFIGFLNIDCESNCK